MSDQEDFDQEITPFQEHTIAFVVILIFGAMYLFFMKGCQPTASLITQTINPQTAQVSPDQNQSQRLSNQGVIADVEQQDDSQRLANSAEVSDSTAEVEAATDNEPSTTQLQQATVDDSAEAISEADNAERIKAEAANLAAATAAQKLADEKRFQQKQAELKAGTAELVIPKKASTQAVAKADTESSATESPAESEPAKSLNMTDELARVNFTLPDGRGVQIPKNGFEDQFKRSILQENEVQTIVFDRVTFFSGSDLLNPESSNQILGVAAIMNTYKDIGIKLRGHTDSAGAAANNLTLSFKRSKNLRDQLVGLGIDTKRIQVEGLGSTEPVSDNSSEKGRNQNRRIDLTIIR